MNTQQQIIKNNLKLLNEGSKPINENKQLLTEGPGWIKNWLNFHLGLKLPNPNHLPGVSLGSYSGWFWRNPIHKLSTNLPEIFEHTVKWFTHNFGVAIKDLVVYGNPPKVIVQIGDKFYQMTDEGLHLIDPAVLPEGWHLGDPLPDGFFHPDNEIHHWDPNGFIKRPESAWGIGGLIGSLYADQILNQNQEWHPPLLPPDQGQEEPNYGQGYIPPYIAQ